MNCSNCGTQVPDESAFCHSCGAPVGQPPPSVEPEQPVRRRAWLPVTAAAAFVGAVVAAVAIVLLVVQPLGGGEAEDSGGRPEVAGPVESPEPAGSMDALGLTAESEGIRLTVTEVTDPVEGALAYGGASRCVRVGFRVNNGADFPIEIEVSDIFVAYADRFRPPDGVFAPCYVDDPRLANVFFVGHRLLPGEALAGVVGFSPPKDERVKSFIVVVGAPVPGGPAERGIRLEVPLSAVTKIPSPTPEPPTASATIIMIPTIQFDTVALHIFAVDWVEVLADNQDTGIRHNLAVYTDDSASELIARTEICNGPCQDTLTLKLEPGEYFFRCDVHPTQMTGTIVVR